MEIGLVFSLTGNRHKPLDLAADGCNNAETDR